MPAVTRKGGKPKRGAKASVGKAVVSGGDDTAAATATATAAAAATAATDDKAAGEPVIDPPDPAKDPEGFKEWNPNPIVQKVAIARAFIQAAGQKMDGSALKTVVQPRADGKTLADLRWPKEKGGACSNCEVERALVEEQRQASRGRRPEEKMPRSCVARRGERRRLGRRSCDVRDSVLRRAEKGGERQVEIQGGVRANTWKS